ncbi:WecB/TagA/CpsF family glycosyltransferase [Acetobacter suratthaniensis]|uniref:WecB/TagA/CpsF family glycosyltransferase n=1 Tax=Acetobacter suratthaniensis TaxID=1502841 RepID=A0ABS3LLE5_9PROT|nr:WecB/TagA/CpsF family glycosyltransferase [Acetobacter suratthaniensis]MBO1328185.1 WecB/TagA/CpsF family glycosyltransferase [Acetobacter suratthaniensis]MCX2566306.1 WecB/TagA/CpsF family glycosyltransferase [Acetobacter suratthaniensis]
MPQPTAERSPQTFTLFGLEFSTLSEQDIATEVASTLRTPAQGVGQIITPNIQHISLMRHNPALRQACQHAALLTCDGFPLYYYAKWRGKPTHGRVTGRGIVAELVAQPARLTHHRIFMVLDSARTVDIARDWAARHGLAEQLDCAVPAMGFDKRPAEMQALAEQIARHGTTLLLMGVGAPRSEIFVDQYRASLPPCWALCIGQGLLIALGCVPKPPRLVEYFNIEWLWRIILEPRRMVGRYACSAVGFMLAVFKDLLHHG